jgi:nitronate monooxygenase
MWPTTKITQLLNISLPIIQAPMAGVTTPELVAAVSNAGGLGSLALGYSPPEDMRKAIQAVKALTQKPYAVNLFIPEEHPASADQLERARQAVAACCKELNFKVSPVHAPFAPVFDEQMQVIIDEKVSVFSFTFGIPSERWLQELKKNNVVLIGTATNLAEAKLLTEKGIDIIVGQGMEAGGHRGTFIGKAKDSLFDVAHLVKSIIYNTKTPVVAAGGIMNAEGIVGALASGAVGVQMGTAFLACPETGTSTAFKQLLLQTEFDDTTLTTVFSGKMARGIKNKFITRMQEHEQDILSYPIQNALTSPLRKAAASQNNTDFMSLWAGQHAYLTTGKPAAELIEEWNQMMSQLFKDSSSKK